MKGLSCTGRNGDCRTRRPSSARSSKPPCRGSRNTSPGEGGKPSSSCRKLVIARYGKAHVPVEHLYLSVVTLGEIERGIEKRRGQDPAFADALAAWQENMARLYADRILPVTPIIARRWGRLSAQLGHDGANLLIAATALAHGLTVVTRNTGHFEPTGAPVINPFSQ
ncbi:MAG: type II toxin-antitoxin system VapC family toxin [Rhodocyclaceae bacterium]|nr:type II toxin-antitoxin system VapC family toxin [Rhodocyclaceae bacterium]